MQTCAKINLFLKVLGTRPDGYHDLETVFLPISGLYDDVTVSPSAKQELSISCNDHELETEKNLCLKAARAFCAKTGCPQSFHVELVKRIPVAAGLGGGSSDAAATLLQLNSLVEAPLSQDELRKLAATVGADVPFFLQSRPAKATGIGDILSPIDISAKLNVLVVSPGIPIPVKWAYDHCQPQPAVTLAEFCEACASQDVEAIAKLCHNDLEYAIFDKFPLIAMMRDHLLQDGALCVHVSGSGSSLFAILPSNPKDDAFASFLQQQKNLDICDKFATTFQDVKTLSIHHNARPNTSPTDTIS